MKRYKRTVFDKLNTLLFGKDLRITQGEILKEVRQGDFSSYYPESDYIKIQPLPTQNVFDIRAFGADVLLDDNAPYINQAIDEASKTGGTVLVDGGDYVTTTVILKSNVTLFVNYGSALCANTTGMGYNHLGIIHADNASNITLTGGGKVKGNGHLFGYTPLYEKNETKPAEYIDVIKMRQVGRAQLRFAHPSKYGGPIYFKECTNVTAYNFIIENSAHWSFRIENCNGVDIKDFVINNNRHVANADGFDIAGTSNVNITHCFVSTADDGICVKNAIWLGCKGAMENLTVKDCEVISCCNAFKIGTETTYDVKNVTVEDCKFYMNDIYPGTVSGIAVESADGSVVSNVKVKNITMDRVTCPIFVRLCNRNRAAQVTAQSANAVEFGQKKKKGGTVTKDTFDKLGKVENVTIENITATNVEIPVIIAGYKQKGTTKYVENVTLNNINLQYADTYEVEDKRLFIPEYATVYPESWRFRNLPSYAIWARHAKNLNITNFSCSPCKNTKRKDIIMQDVI